MCRRDKAAFQSVFDAFDVTDKIDYNTFDKLCEDFLNSGGLIRDRVHELVTGAPTFGSHSQPISAGGGGPSSLATDDTPSKRVLLIDEVDVFFHKDFYGKPYNITSKIRSDKVEALARAVWRAGQSEGPDNVSFHFISTTREYRECVDSFVSDWQFLVETAAKEMIQDLRIFDNKQYPFAVSEDKIGYYTSQGQLDTDIVYGYETMFLYFKCNDEAEGKKISDESLRQHIFLNVRCGSFSYAEIPNGYGKIIGVTGVFLFVITCIRW